MVTRLPPMPSNDNRWWKDNKVERIEIKPIKECRHLRRDGKTAFEITENGAKCMICGLGFLGEGFEIRDGKLFNNKLSAH